MNIDNSTASARLPPQACERHFDDDRVHFTPIKSSNPIAPRAWDRKPSNSYLSRSKSRKVWKRFRSSFNSLKALHQLTGTESGMVEERELMLEINMGRNPWNSRGIKRQRLALSGQETGVVANEEYSAELGAARRSFLETKWESEATRKKRKLPAGQFTTLDADSDESMSSVDDLQSEENLDNDMVDNGDVLGMSTSKVDSSMQDPLEWDKSSVLTPGDPARLAMAAAYPHALPGKHGHLLDGVRGVVPNIKPFETVNEPEVHLSASTICGARDGATAANSDAILDIVMTGDPQLRQPGVATTNEKDQATTIKTKTTALTTEQESTLVRSALRSSLGGEDTELLNNFLSKAKAKREAKAAAEAEAAAAASAPVMIAQDAEEEAKSERMPQVLVEIPTPDRRALEDLDANSPSPMKTSVSLSKPGSQDGENMGDKGSVPASPVGRRSTRPRAAKSVVQRTTAPTGVRSAFSLRRAKGTEFVFLQRTEAQELALLTRRNTRQNKGDSLLPKYTLQGLARRTPETSPTDLSHENEHPTEEDQKAKKHVCWNDEQLVEFEGESGDDQTAEDIDQGGKATTRSPGKRRAASSRSSRSQTSSKTGGDKDAGAAATAAATAPPRARRVRRLGPSKPDPAALAAITTTGSPSSGSGSPTPSPPSPSASPAPKRKKLTPKSPKASLLRTPSKVSSSSGSSSDDKPLLGGSRSVKTSLLKVNAGSTPMPRRVRSRS